MVDFSGKADLDGFFSPLRAEVDVRDCQVVGRIPPELDGAFFRVGSDWDFPPLHSDDAPFNEDGYVSAFRIRNGRCSFKGRWVHTERMERNRAAGRQLYGYYRNPFTDDPSIRDLEAPARRSTSNTAPLIHAGKLYAVKEDGLPRQLDPVTLATMGSEDFGGAYTSQTFTAHAKTDPVTGELIAYGYEASGLCSNDLWIYVIGPDGQIRREIRIKTPYVSMAHDIGLTREHIVIPVFPYVTGLDWLKAGKLHWAWDPHAPTYYGVLARAGDGSDLRWFKGPGRAVVHTLNAVTHGDKVILDAPIFEGNPFPFFPSLDGSRWNPDQARALIRRVILDLSSPDDGCVEEVLFPDRPVVDLVRIDDRYATQPYRYGFTAFRDDELPFEAELEPRLRRRVANCYGRFDLQRRSVDTYFAGPTHSLQEVQFVPRPGGHDEGDGYIIGTASNFAQMRTELIIADARNLGAGEIARVLLPFRASQQVHGKWATPAELPALGEWP